MTPSDRAREIISKALHRKFKNDVQSVHIEGWIDLTAIASAISLAVEEEREACAKVAEDLPVAETEEDLWTSLRDRIASAIRARTKKRSLDNLAEDTANDKAVYGSGKPSEGENAAGQ